MKFISIAKMVMLVGLLTSSAFAQRKPEPPQPETVEHEQLAEEFRVAYADNGRPNIAVFTALAAPEGNDDSTVRRLNHAIAIDQQIKRRLLQAGPPSLSANSPAIYRVSDTTAPATQVTAWQADAWGNVAVVRVAQREDRPVLEQLSMDDPLAVAKGIGEKYGAGLVAIIRILETQDHFPWYSGAYDLIDIRRARLLGSHSWRFQNVDDSGHLPWQTVYGRALADRIMKDYVAAANAEAMSGGREFTLRIQSAERLDTLKVLETALAELDGIDESSIRLLSENASGHRTRTSIAISYSGELMALRDTVVSALANQSAGVVVVREVREGHLDIQIGDIRVATSDAGPDYEFMRECVPKVIAECADRSDGATVSQAGSAILVSLDGLFLTNRHVVVDREDGRPCDSINLVFSSGKTYSAAIAHISQKLDVAVLRVDAEFSHALGFATERHPGQKVFIFGYPAAAEQLASEIASSAQPTRTTLGEESPSLIVTSGVLGAIRQVGGEVGELLQSDAAMYGGNSGGPMTNDAGEVLGVNTLRHRDYEGVNIAISWQAVREDLVTAGFTDIPWPQ